MKSPRFIESKHRRNFRYGTAAGFLLGAGVLLACQTSQKIIVQHEDDLSVAGFVVRQANTFERQTMLNLLPAHRVVRRMHDGKIRFVYADPSVCDCLYVGSQQAYDLYVKIRLEEDPGRQRPAIARM